MLMVEHLIDAADVLLNRLLNDTGTMPLTAIYTHGSFFQVSGPTAALRLMTRGDDWSWFEVLVDRDGHASYVVYRGVDFEKRAMTLDELIDAIHGAQAAAMIRDAVAKTLTTS